MGGPFSTAALQQMKDFGRIAVSGGIATYNDTTPQTGLYILSSSIPVSHFNLTAVGGSIL